MPTFHRGEVFEERWTLDDQVIDRFAELSGDVNPVHMDPTEAKAYGFPKRVAHGALSVALLSRLIGMKIPGAGALWLGHRIEWQAPVFVGDELILCAKVENYSEAAALLHLSFQGTNQRGQVVLQGEAQVKVNTKLTGDKAVKTAQIALVTGGTRGIGAAITCRLADDGFKVAINYLQDDRSAQQIRTMIESKGGTCLLIPSDIRAPNGPATILDTVQKTFGHPDVIVHAATPRLVARRIAETSYDDVDHYLQPYIRGALTLIARASPHMIQQNFGRFIFLGTSALFGQPPSGYGPYIIAKSALWGLVRCAAQELGPFGITVNMVSPGLTITDLTGDLPARIKEIEARKVAVKRLATPEDTAAAVAFLARPEAGYLNGVNLPLTGGPVC